MMPDEWRAFMEQNPEWWKRPKFGGRNRPETYPPTGVTQMNAITIPQNMGALSQHFAGAAVDNDLAAGVQAGFGLIGYRGKVWAIKYRGEEKQLMREDGDGPRGSIEVVILKASKNISKIFYENGWTEGSTAAPDCFSTNGVTPDPAAAKKQCNTCAACPKNAWGSRITPAGKAGKACSDNKRLAVVPAQDIRNEVFGGPMMLRVPAASLQDLAGYGTKMHQLGYPYYAIATRISFDPQESYPKFVFGAIRALTDEEARAVVELQNSPLVDRILAEGSEFAEQSAPPVQAALQQAFEQPPVQATPVQAAPQPAPQPTAQAPQPGAQPAPAPAQGGFGPMSAPAQPVQQAPQPVQQPVQQAAPPPQAQPEPDNAAFEAALDAKLNELLPN